ncbi:chemotaxis protein CheW [Sphingomonas melonis]|jgi:purine-binding chemotaxis protein CheW|uniref:Purine-binding chemotaxis protein CheW n=1 Tax=Sphingomonas melonis TaxID=152682 RepID=A0A7Y9K0P4_9SPHN|nr:chemotaxis protein CheW [Sphingomonas melonis]NYD90078.1 purine-binding chemotaxis protein CheW [Sphingomonas melonis]
MSGGDSALQTIVFGIGDELFALPIGVVREILDHGPAFRVPNAPDWLIGLCDVRGLSVPMVDFRICLGLPTVEVTPATRVLVVESDTGGARPLVIGLVVDRVLDVSTWPREAVEPLPDTGTAWHSRHVVSVLRRDGGFVGLLELGGILQGMEQVLTEQPTAPRAAAVS